MAKVAYQGPADVRILSSRDLNDHAGVEGFRKTEFPIGEAVEVEADVAKALVEHGHVFGEFQIIDANEKLDISDESEGKPDTSSKQTNVPAPTKTTSGSTSRSTTGR